MFLNCCIFVSCCIAKIETFWKQKKLFTNFLETNFTTMLQKTDDPRLAYVLEKIRELRIRFPVADIAEKTGLLKGQVSKVLNGKVALSDNFFETFCNAYGLDGNYNPFPLGDPQNWERAKIIALERRLALALSKISALEGKPRSVENYLDDIDDDTDMILADLRKGGKP